MNVQTEVDLLVHKVAPLEVN